MAEEEEEEEEEEEGKNKLIRPLEARGQKFLSAFTIENVHPL